MKTIYTFGKLMIIACASATKSLKKLGEAFKKLEQ